MHPTEPKNAFLVMRANGWSLGSISRQLGVPKSTLFNWESDPPARRAINVMKSLQLEKLQEKYIPSFEEELQRLSTCLCRIERALEKQDFEAMRPEFLLRTSLQLRSRLNKLRSDVQPTRTLDHGELPPNPLPGCITRSRTEIVEDGQPEFGVPASAGRDSNLSESVNGDADVLHSSPSPLSGEGRLVTPKSDEGGGEVSPSPLRRESDSEVLHPKWDENENFSEPEPSTAATSNNENSTIVPNPAPVPASSSSSSSSSNPNPDSCAPSRAHERYGELATPFTNIPVHAGSDQIALSAGFRPPPLPGSRPAEGHRPPRRA